MLPDVRACQRWRHFTGSTCRVVCLATREDRALVVVFEDERNGGIGCMPLSGWHDHVERGVRRYTLAEGAK